DLFRDGNRDTLGHAPTRNLGQASPVDDDEGTHRITPTLRAVDSEAALRDGIGWDEATHPQMGAVAAGQNALQQFTLDIGVREVTVSSFAAAPIAEDAARVMRMIAQSG